MKEDEGIKKKKIYVFIKHKDTNNKMVLARGKEQGVGSG